MRVVPMAIIAAIAVGEASFRLSEPTKQQQFL
jgi:hypothetical protein